MNQLIDLKQNMKIESGKKSIKKKHPRNPFTKEEDNLLKKMVEKYGDGNWEFISKKIPHRNSRQCRDRWFNYLSPKIINIPWTKEEDDLLVKKYEELGPFWKKIATFFPNRTDINIKSRWNLRERRLKKEKLMLAKKIYYQRILNFHSAPIGDQKKKDDIIENSMNGQIIDNNNNLSKKNQNEAKDQMIKIEEKNCLSEEFLNELTKEFENNN